MSYKQFLEKVRNEIQIRFGASYSIQINPVLKNNSVELDGLVILKEGEKAAPNIYLNEYYLSYEKKKEFNLIIEEIIEEYTNSALDKKDEYEYELDFKKMKERIYYRIVNFSKNEKLLKDMPNIKFLDLAITFHCLIKDDETGIGSIRITSECMKKWNITAKELMKVARVNTPVLFPPSIRTMEEVISEIIDKEAFDVSLDENKKIDSTPYNVDSNESIFGTPENQLIKQMVYKKRNAMYIVSNTRGINGASVILYKDIIRKFAIQMDTDFYILPSSIHEVILVPYHVGIAKESLEEMVFDINHTQVSQEEVLSNQVYLYHRVNNVFL